jgi:hypothetical protein
MSVFKCDISYTKVPGDSKTSAFNLLKAHGLITSSYNVPDYQKAVLATNELSEKASAVLGRTVKLYSYATNGKSLNPNSSVFMELDLAVNRDVKLETLSLYNNYTASEFQNLVNTAKERDVWSVLLDQKNKDIVKNRRVTLAIAAGLSKMFNVDYQVITESEALELVTANGIFYSGEPGFYVGNKIYFVEGKYDKEIKAQKTDVSSEKLAKFKEYYESVLKNQEAIKKAEEAAKNREVQREEIAAGIQTAKIGVGWQHRRLGIEEKEIERKNWVKIKPQINRSTLNNEINCI